MKLIVGAILLAVAMELAMNGLVRVTVVDMVTWPCAWHAAVVTEVDSGNNSGYGAPGVFVDYRYVRGGVTDGIAVSAGFVATVHQGERVYIEQCQHGFGVVHDAFITTAPQPEGPDVPSVGND